MPFLFIGAPLAVVMILNIFRWKNYWTAFRVALGVTVFQMGLACFDLYYCLFEQKVIRSDFFGRLSVDLFSAIVLLTIGFIVPILIMFILIYLSGNFDKFWFWTFTYLSQYGKQVVTIQNIIDNLFLLKYPTNKQYFVNNFSFQ